MSNRPCSPIDEALALAHKAIGVSDPNPRVGCVLVGSDGTVIGSGHTQRAGEAHAEVMALREARARGCDPSGGTAFVTLEPCSHHGRTPPCCDALIEARIANVVIAVPDPNPVVAGFGIQRLRAAGINVLLAAETGEVEAAEASRELNIGFFSRMKRARPWVRVKVAASLDGHTALTDGKSKWITCEAARSDGHAWRKRAGAVLTGVGTVLTDNPRLDVRCVPTELQPLRVIVDSRLQTPPDARILDAPGEALIYAAIGDVRTQGELEQRGAHVVVKPDRSGKVDLAAMLVDLAARGLNELHVEAGQKLNGSLARERLIDEWLIYFAPLMLGDGRTLADFPAPPALADAQKFQWRSVERIGDDLRIVARVIGADDGL